MGETNFMMVMLFTSVSIYHEMYAVKMSITHVGLLVFLKIMSHTVIRVECYNMAYVIFFAK
jgi:hypothetical protein